MVVKMENFRRAGCGRAVVRIVAAKIAADPDLELFTKRTQALRQTLRNVPLSAPPLHDSIMRAVRRAGQREQTRRAPILSWWAASGAVAALAVVCLYLTYMRPKLSRTQALDGPVLVLEMSEHMQTSVPSLVMSPLSNEWALVDHDLQDTKQVLLASLP
jgi:cytochrome c-type biogenesis protein CcmH/NrfG